MLKQTVNTCKYENDALILAKAAKIIRDDIANFNAFNFDGYFPPNCQQNSLPTNLKYFISFLLNGPNIGLEESQSCLSISQTILFNCKKGKSTGVKHRHSLNLEPPLPLHIGLSIHTKTRSKKLITELYELGLCVSYERILQLENKLTTSICEHTREIGLVCPIQLHHKLFTVGALDNIDHNPSSTTAMDHFFGTKFWGKAI